MKLVNIIPAVSLVLALAFASGASNRLCRARIDYGCGTISRSVVTVDLADAVYMINYVFKGGPAPVEPCCP